MTVESIQPTDDVNYIQVVTSKSGELILKILDVQGRMAKTIREKVEQGANELAVNLSDLAEGVYVLNAFIGDSFIKAFRFKKN